MKGYRFSQVLILLLLLLPFVGLATGFFQGSSSLNLLTASLLVLPSVFLMLVPLNLFRAGTPGSCRTGGYILAAWGLLIVAFIVAIRCSSSFWARVSLEDPTGSMILALSAVCLLVGIVVALVRLLVGAWHYYRSHPRPSLISSLFPMRQSRLCALFIVWQVVLCYMGIRWASQLPDGPSSPDEMVIVKLLVTLGVLLPLSFPLLIWTLSCESDTVCQRAATRLAWPVFIVGFSILITSSLCFIFSGSQTGTVLMAFGMPVLQPATALIVHTYMVWRENKVAIMTKVSSLKQGLGERMQRK